MYQLRGRDNDFKWNERGLIERLEIQQLTIYNTWESHIRIL